MMGTFIRWILGLAVIGLVGIQFVPTDRSNPAVTGDLSAPDLVVQTLRNSCYDCHSNETRWPWYSRIAPVSWRIVGHVREAREHLNFSEWQGLSVEDREDVLKEIWEEIEKGAMPLSDYLTMHPEAELTDIQLDAVRRWTEGRDQEFPDWN